MKNQLIMGILGIMAAANSATGCKESPNTVAGIVKMQPDFEKALSPTAVLYIVARPHGTAGGPPLAVKRFAQPLTFPLEFNLSEADVMLPNSPFKGSLSVTARISQTGSAAPARAGDIEGLAEPTLVEVGSNDSVVINLSQIRK